GYRAVGGTDRAVGETVPHTAVASATPTPKSEESPMIRFTTSDVVVAEAADQLLVTAMSALAARTNHAANALGNFEPDGRQPEDILAALLMWRRYMDSTREQVDEILALLLMRGASRRGLAEALGVRPATLRARVAGQRAATAARSDLTRDTRGNWTLRDSA
ncbi:MAG: hypothetical protein WAV90_10085, partial [Gordonia amarae]